MARGAGRECAHERGICEIARMGDPRAAASQASPRGIIPVGCFPLGDLLWREEIEKYREAVRRMPPGPAKPADDGSALLEWWDAENARIETVRETSGYNAAADDLGEIWTALAVIEDEIDGIPATTLRGVLLRLEMNTAGIADAGEGDVEHTEAAAIRAAAELRAILAAGGAA